MLTDSDDSAMRFARKAIEQQLRWAEQTPPIWAALERDPKTGRQRHVLRREEVARNLWRPEWIDFVLKDRRHRWFRALNSSQAFAVNLFGPMREDETVAQRFWRDHLGYALQDDKQVLVQFEFSYKWDLDDGLADLLHEDDQETQVDVLLKACAGDRPGRLILIEVKYSESEFGKCRGFGKRTKNQNTDRCLNGDGRLFTTPTEECWLAEAGGAQVRGRRYWEYLTSPQLGVDAALFRAGNPCPFRTGVYQLMRNRVLADALVRTGRAPSADVATCLHPGNDQVAKLQEPVDGTRDVLDAFDRLFPSRRLIRIDPRSVVALTKGASSRWGEWADMMTSRYELI